MISIGENTPEKKCKKKYKKLKFYPLKFSTRDHPKKYQFFKSLVLVYTQEGSLWSIVLRCDDHTGIFTCDGCARDPYFYVPAATL